jgi:mRNA interferase RelE/StbE
MIWTAKYLSEAEKDARKLDPSIRPQIRKGIEKTLVNPLPKSEGGYGEPLGNKAGTNLTGLLRIKFRDLGIRVVYALKRIEGQMVVIVISVREDDKVYREAQRRRELYGL